MRAPRIALGLSLLALALGSPAAAQSQTPRPPTEPGVLATAPVVLDGVELFRVRGVSAIPAAERARIVSDRIRELAADPSFDPATLRFVEKEAHTDIVAGDRLVVTLRDADAALEEVRRSTLVDANLFRIRAAIESYRAERTRSRLIEHAAYALAATLAFVVALFLVFVGFRRLVAVLESRYKRQIQGISIQSLQLVEAERILQAVRAAVFGLRTAVLIGLALVWAGVVFGLFPWTRPLARELVGYVVQPLSTLGAGFLEILPDLVFLAILIALTRYLLGLLSLFFEAIARGTIAMRGFEREWAWPTYRIVRILTIAFAVVIAFPYIPGSGSEAFRGVSIFIGVVFSLGSSSVVANMVAGYSMIYRRTFKLGDRVKIGDTVGDVTELRLQVTHLRTQKNEEVIVPNSLILGSEVVNYSSFAREGRLVLHTTVGIGYEVPWRQVEAMLVLAAERTPGLLREPPPFVLQKSLGDFAVLYEINVFTDDARQMPALYSALHRSILDVFNEHGVQIMTPAYEGDPPQPKVVPRERWFEAPARKSED